MPSNQALGLLLVAVGLACFLLIDRLRRQTRQDPRWLWRGELQQLVSAAAAPFLNAFLFAGGGFVGVVSLGGGLFLLTRV